MADKGRDRGRGGGAANHGENWQHQWRELATTIDAAAATVDAANGFLLRPGAVSFPPPPYGYIPGLLPPPWGFGGPYPPYSQQFTPHPNQWVNP
jgi:hypothetical protein